MLFQIMAFIFGIIFFQQELNQTGYMNINGALFILLTNSTFRLEQTCRPLTNSFLLPNFFKIMCIFVSNLNVVVVVFCEELPLFLRLG
jgi:hypothetical protein